MRHRTESRDIWTSVEHSNLISIALHGTLKRSHNKTHRERSLSRLAMAICTTTDVASSLLGKQRSPGCCYQMKPVLTERLTLTSASELSPTSSSLSLTGLAGLPPLFGVVLRANEGGMNQPPPPRLGRHCTRARLPLGFVARHTHPLHPPKSISILTYETGISISLDIFPPTFHSRSVGPRRLGRSVVRCFSSKILVSEQNWYRYSSPSRTFLFPFIMSWAGGSVTR